jgi:hypothetical protein
LTPCLSFSLAMPKRTRLSTTWWPMVIVREIVFGRRKRARISI